jgi:glucosamine-6-phosphate deaminase
MKILIHDDYAKMSARAAQLIIEFVSHKPESLLCFAAGNSPLGTFASLVEASRQGLVDFSRCRFVSLDEWVGLDGQKEGSCRKTLHDHFFNPLSIGIDQIHFFDGLSEDLPLECRWMDEFIASHGGIDLFLLGVGMNGHLGFNEPGIDLDLYSHVIDLDPVTTAVSVKYFNGAKPFDQGITLGVKYIMEADQVIVVADGAGKADIIASCFQGEITKQIPASILRHHDNLHVCLDAQAAAKMDQTEF